MKGKLMFIGSIVVMLSLFGAVLYIPQAVFDREDKKTEKKVFAVERDSLRITYEMKLSMSEKVALMKKILKREENMTLTLFTEKEEELINGMLLDHVKKELDKMSTAHLIPEVGGFVKKRDFIDASYYTYFNPGEKSKTNEQLSCWVLRFGNYQNYDMTVIVDAEDYKIYRLIINAAREVFDVHKLLNNTEYMENGTQQLTDYFEVDVDELEWIASANGIEVGVRDVGNLVGVFTTKSTLK